MANETNGSTAKKQPDLIVYLVSQNGDKQRFTRIGAGWKNSKGGVLMKLNGDILMLPPRPKKEGRA